VWDVIGRRKSVALACDVEQTQDAGVDGAQDVAGRRWDVPGAQDRSTEWTGCELWRGLGLLLLAHPPLLAVVYFVGGAADIFEVKSWWGWVNTHHAK
jgi:hypothetical protein